MPVRIYEISKKLGIPNKVILQKAKELNITAARAASCSLDKITAEFLEKELLKSAAPTAETKAPAATEQAKEQAPVAAEAEPAKEAPEEVAPEQAKDAEPVSEKKEEPISVDAPVAEATKPDQVEKVETTEKTIPADEIKKPVESEAKPEPIKEQVEKTVSAPKEESPAVVPDSSVPAPEPKKTAVPQTDKADIDQFIKDALAGLSELDNSADARGARRPNPRRKKETKPDQVEKVEKIERTTPTEEIKKPVEAEVKPEQVKEQVANPVPAPTAATAPAPAPEPQRPAVSKPSAFAMRPLWQVPSAIGRRLAETAANKENTSEPVKPIAKPEEKPEAPVVPVQKAPEPVAPSAPATQEAPVAPMVPPVAKAPVSTPAAPAPERSVISKTPDAKLGQKVGFIQLPQKNTGSPKQKDNESKGQSKFKDSRRDRNGRDNGKRSDQQGGRNQQGSQDGQRSQQFSQGQNRFQGQGQGGRQQGQNQRFSQGGNNNGRQGGQRDGRGFGKQDDRGNRNERNDRNERRDSRFQQSAMREAFSKVGDGAKVITMKAPIVVRQLAELLGRKPYQLIADLMEQGVFANVNQSIEEAVAKKLCAKHGFAFELERRDKGGALVKGDQKKVEIVDEEDDPASLKPRPPVVTIMGHVDHGKTTLLDSIRKSHVASGEAGGITQHIGAYTISIPHPERPNELQQITFLDTPGHEAFSAMRARGANVTDIVILVVAANDGVMPQTIEAIRHAQAAKVTIMVAVNKCDLPGANPMRARQQLQEYGLLCEEWGGSTVFMDVSALNGTGVDDLLGMLVLQAEVLELKANPDRKAKGNVVESGLAPGGPTATVLVRKGTLKLGDAILCGEYYGKARALINEEGQRLKEATPSVAVKLLGLNGVPEAGTEFLVVANDKIARSMAEEQRERIRLEGNQNQEKAVTLEGFMKNFDAEDAKVLKIVVKGDTQGSVEAIVDALKKIESKKVSLEVIHSAVGTITESDVILASASRAVIVGFHTRIDSSASEVARRESVQIKLYSIIYELIDQVRDAMAGLLDPIINEVPLGMAEVRQLFDLSKGGMVAGCMVTQGKIAKGRCRVLRGKETIFEGSFQSIRHFQDEVNELKAGMECGIRIDGFREYQVGDFIQSYTVEKVAQEL